MTVELSIVTSSADGNNFEIVIEDVDYTDDAHEQRYLPEVMKGRRSSLFAIERDPNYRENLKALRSYSSGVYILINTELTREGKRSVFVGMADSYERIAGDYERSFYFNRRFHRKIEDINQKIMYTDRQVTLHECLEEQSENPPKYMKNWDLAIIIPEYAYNPVLFSMLSSIFARANGFVARKTSSDHASYDLFRMHSDHHYFFGGSKFIQLSNYYNYPADFISDPNLYSYILAVVGFVARKIRKKIAKSKDKRSALKQGGELNITGDDNQVIWHKIRDGDGESDDVSINGNRNKIEIYEYPNLAVKYLNTHFPSWEDLNRRSRWSNDFDE